MDKTRRVSPHCGNQTKGLCGNPSFDCLHIHSLIHSRTGDLVSGTVVGARPHDADSLVGEVDLNKLYLMGHRGGL